MFSTLRKIYESEKGTFRHMDNYVLKDHHLQVAKRNIFKDAPKMKEGF